MLKQIFWPISILICLTGCQKTAVNLTTKQMVNIENEVTIAFNGLVKSSKDFDFDGYQSYFSKELFTELKPDGTTLLSFDEFEKDYRPQFAIPEKYLSLNFKSVRVTVLNQTTATLTNEFEAVILLKSGEQVATSGGGLQVWSKVNDQWKIVGLASGGLG